MNPESEDNIELKNATKITSPSGLPCRPFSALRQQLHSFAMRLLSRLEYERLYGGSALGLQTRQDGIAQKGGEPWPCKRSRVSSGLRVRSGLRSFERLTRDGKAGLYAKRKVRTPIHGYMGWVKSEGLNAQYRTIIGPVPKQSRIAQHRDKRSMEFEVQQA